MAVVEVAERAPEGYVLLRAFLGGARDPAGARTRPMQEMISTAMNAMRPLIGITGEPLFTRVYRWENANAQHEVGHLDRVAAIDRELATHPGLFITGSGFRGVGIPDCVADGVPPPGRYPHGSVRPFRNARVPGTVALAIGFGSRTAVSPRRGSAGNRGGSDRR